MGGIRHTGISRYSEVSLLQGWRKGAGIGHSGDIHLVSPLKVAAVLILGRIKIYAAGRVLDEEQIFRLQELGNDGVKTYWIVSIGFLWAERAHLGNRSQDRKAGSGRLGRRAHAEEAQAER